MRRDLGLPGRGTPAVEAGEINLPFRGPDRHVPTSVGSDRVIGHGTPVDLPGGAADPPPLDPAPVLVPEDEIHVALVAGLFAVEDGQPPVRAIRGARCAAVAWVVAGVQLDEGCEGLPV